MQRISSLLLFSTIALYITHSIEPYNNIGATTSGTSHLYNSLTPITQGIQRTFNISYTTPKTTNPQLIYGISGY